MEEENHFKKRIKIGKRNHKDVAKDVAKEEATMEKGEVKKTSKPKPSKPFTEGNDGFVRSTISIPNDFGRFLHEEVLYGGIKKKKLTEVIMGLLEDKYGRDFMKWMEDNE